MNFLLTQADYQTSFYCDILEPTRLLQNTTTAIIRGFQVGNIFSNWTSSLHNTFCKNLLQYNKCGCESSSMPTWTTRATLSEKWSDAICICIFSYSEQGMYTNPIWQLVRHAGRSSPCWWRLLWFCFTSARPWVTHCFSLWRLADSIKPTLRSRSHETVLTNF